MTTISNEIPGAQAERESAPVAEVSKVTVEAIKAGWVHRGKSVQVGQSAEVTESQAKRLRDKGLVK